MAEQVMGKKYTPATKVVEIKNQLPSKSLPHLLVVDDENGPRQALRMLLKEEFVVHLASTVAQALEKLETLPIELVITDIRMPNQSGVDLLQQVKESRPDVQVIIYTGYGQLETAMKAVEFGAFSYVEKPFDNDAMLKIVRAGQAKFHEEQDRRAMEYLTLEASRFETLGHLVSGVMHDMASPLTVLRSQIELLTINHNRPDIKVRLASMQTQVEHCADMARSTLEFLRHESDAALPLSVNDVLESCLELTRSVLREVHVEVRQNLSNELPQIRADLVLIRQAILNIITNACQALESTDGDRRLHIKTWSEDTNVCISFEDSGLGVNPANRDTIFEVFFTSRGRAGTGLGLSVVKNVMSRCNGSVSLEDGQDTGAYFVLRFPAYISEPR